MFSVAMTFSAQLRAARRLLRVSQHKAAAAIERPFRAVRRAEGGAPSGADVRQLLYDLYVRNGVVFEPSGHVWLGLKAKPGLTVAAAAVTRLSGDVRGQFYKIEVRGGEVTGIWRRVTERFGQRAPVEYWAPVFGFERPRRAARKLRPVIEEVLEALAQAKADGRI
jgi:hypothetical protein